MTQVLVEYSRFVEVQQRRATILEELVAPRETPAQHVRRSVDERATGESPSRVADARTSRGVADVR